MFGNSIANDAIVNASHVTNNIIDNVWTNARIGDTTTSNEHPKGQDQQTNRIGNLSTDWDHYWSLTSHWS